MMKIVNENGKELFAIIDNGELKVKDKVIQEEDVEKIFDESAKKGDE